MDLEIIILSEVRERQILHDITDMSNIKSNKTLKKTVNHDIIINIKTENEKRLRL